MSQVSLIEIPETISIAIKVILGEYGNGEERKRALEAEGFDYYKVQHCVNDLLKLKSDYK